MIPVEVLPNGVQIVVDDTRTARAAIHVLVEAGSSEDPPGRSGLAHLVEHLVYADGEFDLGAARSGGRANAWTDQDHTSFWSVFPGEAASEAARLHASLLVPNWPASALSVQRDVVEEERARERLPGGLDRAWLAELLWPDGHPYRRRVMGTSADLAQVTDRDAREFIGTHYRGGAVTVAIAGRVPGGIRDTFGVLPSAAPVAEASVPGPIEAPVVVERTADVDRPTVYLAWRGPARAHPDRIAIDAVAGLLADVVVPFGVNRDVGAWAGDAGGTLVVSLRSKHGLARAVRMIDRALDGLRAQGPSPDALARVVGRRRADLLRMLEAPEDRAQALAMCARHAGVGDCWTQDREAWSSLVPDTVARAARTWIGARATLAVVPSGRSLVRSL